MKILFIYLLLTVSTFAQASSFSEISGKDFYPGLEGGCILHAFYDPASKELFLTTVGERLTRYYQCKPLGTTYHYGGCQNNKCEYGFALRVREDGMQEIYHDYNRTAHYLPDGNLVINRFDGYEYELRRYVSIANSPW